MLPAGKNMHAMHHNSFFAHHGVPLGSARSPSAVRGQEGEFSARVSGFISLSRAGREAGQGGINMLGGEDGATSQTCTAAKLWCG